MPILHVDKKSRVILKDVGICNEQPTLVHKEPASERNAMGFIINRDDKGSGGFSLTICFARRTGNCTYRESQEQQKRGYKGYHTLVGLFYHIP